MRGRWMTWAGVALLTAGLAALGWFAWQLYGTNYVAKQRQTEAVEQLHRSWDEPAVREGASQGDGAEALVRIPRFGSDYVMPVFAGTSDEVLARGFGRFDHAPGPGEKGNYALAAHRITHGEPLRDMPKLRPGDLVEVETRSKVFVYRLDTDPNDLVVGFEDGWVVDDRPVNPSREGPRPASHPRLITLTTCAELFHTDERMIAFGHLVQARDKRTA